MTSVLFQKYIAISSHKIMSSTRKKKKYTQTNTKWTRLNSIKLKIDWSFAMSIPWSCAKTVSNIRIPHTLVSARENWFFFFLVRNESNERIISSARERCYTNSVCLCAVEQTGTKMEKRRKKISWNFNFNKYESMD